MARNSNNARGGDNNARIKVVYFEAENVNSDLTGVINAFANAIRTAPVQVVPSPPPPAQIESRKGAAADGNGQMAMPLADGEDDTLEDAVTSAAPKRPAREHKSFKGTILDDINWDGNGTPFVDYIKQKNPQDTMKRYLVIAAWFKRHGGQDAVNSNLVYNAYRKMGWGTVADIGQPLREGARSKRGYFSVGGKGNYAITNIGFDSADKVGSEKSEGES